MKTNLNLFRKNYKTMCEHGNDYVKSSYQSNFRKHVKCVNVSYHLSMMTYG